MQDRKASYTRDELVRCADGLLFGQEFPRLPAAEMLMFDRITAIAADDGTCGKGSLTAELDIRPDLWFFACHFRGDPVMPGCLGLDALWQLCGFFMAWSGCQGKGRALGAGLVKFTGQILPDAQRVTYTLDFKRLVKRTLSMVIADGAVAVDGRPIYSADDLKVGVFASTDGF